LLSYPTMRRSFKKFFSSANIILMSNLKRIKQGGKFNTHEENEIKR